MVSKVERWAKCRADVLKPGTASKDKDGNEDVTAWALIALQRELTKAGMPVGQTAHFTDLLWRCGPALEFQPKLGRMAADWGITRQVLSGKIATWVEQGLCSRKRKWRQYEFRFPRFDVLIQAVQESSSPHALRGRDRADLFKLASSSSCKVKPDTSGKEIPDAVYKGDSKDALKGGAATAAPISQKSTMKKKNQKKPASAKVAKKRSGQPTDPQAGTSASRLCAAVCRGHKAQYGINPDKKTKGEWIGLFNRLLAEPEYTEADVNQAIKRWFAHRRDDVGWALFEHRFRGRNAELWGRGPGDTDNDRGLEQGRLASIQNAERLQARKEKVA